MQAFLNASEVAKLLKVDRATVSRWLQKGMVKGAIKPGTGHQWRIPLAAFEHFVNSSKGQQG